MVAAGRLRESVRFDRRPSVDDGYGNTVSGDWQTLVGPVSAEIREVRGSEAVVSAKLEDRRIVEITVRYQAALATLSNEDRAVDTRTNETYNIHTVDPVDHKKRELRIMAESGGSDD